MGKQGPCYHCGITSTPLWRNGPPEKPVLCNACGSRWRTKGTLVNYTPIHARAFSPLDFGDSKNLIGDKPPSKKSRSQYIQTQKEIKIEDRHSFAAYQPYRTCFEDDTSNKSSSGSAISVSESCVQLGNTDGNDISGPFQSSFCDIRIPSKKRTRIRRHSPSPIEKLRQDLVTILEQQDASYLSEFSEEVLLFEGEAMSFDSETGHGSVLLKPAFSSKEEESEASSRVVGNKICLAETYTESTCCSVKSQNNEISSRQIEKNQMIQDTWNTKDLKENPPKQCASTNIFLEGTLSGNLDAVRSEYSTQTSINEKILSNRSSNSARELSPLTCTGSRSSILTKSLSESPDFYTCEGKSSGTANTLKSSREQSDAELLTSGEDSVHIHASLTGTKNISPAPQSLSSDVDIFH